ncbi:hypothetical protein CcaverHIS002_0206550 [Cutaneotrichosporon cavernicola]|uniref:Mid2 domain-containing protein n=1 Tax=Cutaneotrichosporon cavernicola TaxID=279322 RepID=A0AA48I1B0_9TREE|nr:uncharacterized protein CcaverHIS019_0206530 [Cutaneotrichosporon cavernicola]BEI81495.1 hypothetical protein CcaverHIS002_0206550 [Cutaneotrichosporon cavernicola]BEI89291.1 hypothetical protein CcaverHIS019_0206530 [Cutaneotrichosporon cavernicola]BEI97067.1 hypothetical protein CcaverHIS631_0206560 [Cutaneotrichosporon cavernicola]BEJ04840.1 hypothetical protein CcaverHIS641_0206570 [Cutaneotrichosporon cavernicola]
MATPLAPLASSTTATITSWTTVVAAAATGTATGCVGKGCKKTDKGKVAGIAVGCVLGVFVVAGALALLWFRARRKRDDKWTKADPRISVVSPEEVVVHPPTPVATRAPYRPHISLGRDGCYTPVQYEGEETYVYQPHSNASKSSLGATEERPHPG